VDLQGEGSAQAILDTHAPTFQWLGTTPKVVGAGKRVTFRFRTHDPSGPLAVTVAVEGERGPRGGVEGEVRSGEARLPWRSGRLFPGNYETEFRVADMAGNVTRVGPFPFPVERPMGGRIWTSVPGAGPRVALTIDDCHFSGAWAQMLRTLEERDAGATFFCPGQMIARNPGLARRTIREGHAIGAHGWDHAALTTQPYAGVLRRLRLDAAALRRATGHTTAPYFRPPYGAVNGAVVRAAGQTSHPRVIMWDVDTGDWASPGIGTIISRAVRGAKRGSIILLHTKPQSAAALPAIISGLRDRGLEPVGLPELFAGRGSTKRRR
jgi:peptidoglycan/xylan/chitin deacetylase (PgdA/CDA1 family)